VTDGESPRGAPNCCPSNSHLSHANIGVVFDCVSSRYDKTTVESPQNEPISTIGLPDGICAIA
jgi:hypothetical protein